MQTCCSVWKPLAELWSCRDLRINLFQVNSWGTAGFYTSSSHIIQFHGNVLYPFISSTAKEALIWRNILVVLPFVNANQLLWWNSISLLSKNSTNHENSSHSVFVTVSKAPFYANFSFSLEQISFVPFFFVQSLCQQPQLYPWVDPPHSVHFLCWHWY